MKAVIGFILLLLSGKLFSDTNNKVTDHEK
jgi:hypothetical protein